MTDDHTIPLRIYSRACTRWTTADEEHLLLLIEQGMTVRQIAPVLGRLAGAVDGRLRMLQRAQRENIR